MDKITFGIIGGGWRAEFYLRIAKALPDRFQVSVVLARDEEKGKKLESEWGVKTVRHLEDFLKNPECLFAVVSLPRKAAPTFILALAERGLPVLAETPPAEDIPSLIRLYERVGQQAKIQVAEQYLFQPMHASRIAVAKSGKLGEISQVQVSASHGYHGISLIRQLLGVGYEEAEIRGQRFVSPIIQGPNRAGLPQKEALTESVQDLATLRFGDLLAVFDFSYDQYFSWIRRNRVLIRGHKGEIADREIRYLLDYSTPMYSELRRIDTGHDGNLEGYYHRGIVAGAEWVYTNPFAPGRLTDDEIAVATILDKMYSYVQGGPSFYSLAEASQDQYLALMMLQAIESGQVVTAPKQIWASGS